LRPVLESKGYIIENIDFSSLLSGTGYNPLSFVRYDEDTDMYSEKDINTISSCLINLHHKNDDFWEYAARQYLSILISYVLEMYPPSGHTLKSVLSLIPVLGSDKMYAMMDELSVLKPNSSTYTRYLGIDASNGADKMCASIKGILSTNLDSLTFNDCLAFYENPKQIDFKSIGKRKTAVFLTISDTDRSMDLLANTFITQALHELCYSADHDYVNHRLPYPVRFILDDFATNCYIEDFDKIISVIRSREISVSIILQSISQLYSLYGSDRAKTILNNCDNMLYLGGNCVDTAEYISVKANKPLSAILEMPLDKAYVFIRGEKPCLEDKFDYTKLNHAECFEELKEREVSI